MKSAYQLSKKEVIAQLHVPPQGLTYTDVSKRQEQYGVNELQEGKGKNVCIVFLEQCKDLLVIILMIAALISMMNQETTSAAVILFVIVMNAVLGTVQYFKAEKSIRALKQMSSPKAKVIRQGQLHEVKSRDLVPGDVVVLEAGDMIVADGRVISVVNFQVNESALSGESMMIEKSLEPIAKDVGIADQKNMVFSGSFVVNGKAQMVVTATGMNTELGKIAGMMEEVKQSKTPLQLSMDDFSKKLSMVILIICGIVLFLQLWQGVAFLDATMFAVALAVAAIPEALASIITIVLTLGAQKMAKENAVMKRLYSVETLGSVNVICSDKTGTLTQNRMHVVQYYLNGENHDANDPVSDHLSSNYFLSACTLCEDAIITRKERIGDPMELAILDFVQKQGLDAAEVGRKYRRIDEVPFDSIRKRMSVFIHHGDKQLLLVKGAMDELLRNSVSIYHKDQIVPLDEKIKLQILHQHQLYANDGKRVLGFACRFLKQDHISEHEEQELIFLGLCAMIDPPRQESIQAVMDCHDAGIQTVMITGDHKDTALAIARQTHIVEKSDECCIDGRELDQMSEEELQQQLQNIRVYARVEPKHKQRIIRAFQKQGLITAMTGDGVNDAVALKQADIGIAMGITGTEVSKDAADMILMDDNFATIVKAVSSGRTLVKNIKGAIGYLLSGNVGGILCVLLASIVMLPVPFLPIHLLFINLLSDSLPAVAIGLEPAEQDTLKQRPRSAHDSLISAASLKTILFQGSLIALCTMAGYFYGMQFGTAYAQTIAFAVLCLARLFHGLTCRSDRSLVKVGIYKNMYSLLACLFATLLLHLILYVPLLQSIFQIAPLSSSMMIIIWVLAFLPFLLIQTARLWRERRGY